MRPHRRVAGGTLSRAALGSALVALLSVSPSRGLPAESLSPRDSALHALNRLAYGPRPGDVDRLAAMGTLRWIDQQLDPNRLDNHVLAERERTFTLLGMSREDLGTAYFDDQRARRDREMSARADSALRHGPDPSAPT